jgi:signal recognition particle GTPase
MQDRPTVQELLTAVREFLETDIMPHLDARRSFHARVAANVLGIVGRELEREEDALVAEWTRLAGLVGAGATTLPARLSVLRAGVRDLTARLAERIQRGDADAGEFARAVRAHVRETVDEKLRVANPKLLGE